MSPSRPHSPMVANGAAAASSNLAAMPSLFAIAGVEGGAAAGSRTGITRTYAGGGRTLRQADPKDATDVSDAALLQSPSKATARFGLAEGEAGAAKAAPVPRRETYASLRLLWGIDAEETLDADEEQDSQDRGARVVGSGILRKQGQGKRWMDELGWMCDGLRAGAGQQDGNGDRGAARASAAELVGKAMERDWLRRLKSSGKVEEVYLALRLASGVGGDDDAPHVGADRVLDVALAAALALFVKDQRLVEPLFRITPTDVRDAAAAQHAGPSKVRRQETNGSSAAAADGDQSDLLEVLKALLAREWAAEEIGGATSAGVGRKGKANKGDARQASSLWGPGPRCGTCVSSLLTPPTRFSSKRSARSSTSPVFSPPTRSLCPSRSDRSSC